MAQVTEQKCDVAIVGGGPGGYVAAIRASQLGLKVILVEREHLGGICLNWGCIPAKALLRTSEVHHMLQHLGDYGLSAKEISFDLAAVVQRSRAVSQKLTTGVTFLMKKNKITVVDGQARLAGPQSLAVEKGGVVQTIKAPHILLATGARARILPGLEIDENFVWSYKEAMVPKVFPKRLLVVGAGAIGAEFASFYRDMGAEVILVDVMPRILPVEDEEISAFAHKAFVAQGMRVLTGVKLGTVTRKKSGVEVAIMVDGKEEIVTVDRVISAAGIVGNVENLGLEGTKVVVEKTHIKVDGFGRTGEPGVYAIGDVAGPPWLAHKASHEGVVCVEAIAGLKPHAFETGNIPGCTYCRPQIASVGLTEAAAKAAGYEVKVGKFPFVGNGKAIAMGETEGLVKTVFDAKTGALLGAHMVGAEVTEMIQGFAVARGLETTEEDLMHTIFPHPTISETMHESVLAAYGRAIHM